MTQRQPAGIPIGGQFAAHDRADATATLSRPLGEVRRDFMQLRHAANEARFRLSSHAALLTVNTIKEIAPEAATAVFEHRYDDDSLRVSELRDDEGTELDRDVLDKVNEATRDYLASIAVEDHFILGYNDEEQDGYDRAYKTVPLRGESLTDQEGIQEQLNLDLAAASFNRHEDTLPLLHAVGQRLRANDNTTAADALHNLTANDIDELYERHIEPALDGLEGEIVERADSR